MGNHGSSLDEILAEDMHHWYNKFMRESPSGLITLFELKAILNLRGMNENANSYVDQVFFTFDMDGVCKAAGAPRKSLGSYHLCIQVIFHKMKWKVSKKKNIWNALWWLSAEQLVNHSLIQMSARPGFTEFNFLLIKRADCCQSVLVFYGFLAIRG